ncbi:hypothetical protein IC617_07260 [Neiella sp. HB171785]|uniref:Uncharacterized protein n=1 Tax=Neiella litorisoli TaxID=2771431 RepID=A0A8J6QUM2_9GAMM|nr:hypothetical protein [Neiella litorisoli]MBD1389218.1 hypothetical protein [Neiella litorisoli]
MLCTNFFSWKTQVKLQLKEHHIDVDTDDQAIAKDMEFSYFQRHLSVDDYVKEIVDRHQGG